MTKFVCTKTVYGATVKEGDVIIGELFTQKLDDADVKYIRVTEDSTNLHNNMPRWVVGDEVPLIGILFKWKEVPSKFKCVKSSSSSEYAPKVGDVIEGELIHIQRKHGMDTRISISNVGNRMDVNGKPYWNIGEKVPLKGSVWTWEEIK